MVAHTCNLNTRETEAEGLPQVWGQPAVYGEFKSSFIQENLSLKNQKKKFIGLAKVNVYKIGIKYIRIIWLMYVLNLQSAYQLIVPVSHVATVVTVITIILSINFIPLLLHVFFVSNDLSWSNPLRNLWKIMLCYLNVPLKPHAIRWRFGGATGSKVWDAALGWVILGVMMCDNWICLAWI